LHKKATSKAGAAVKSSRPIIVPAVSGRVKSGACVPSGTINDEAAMPEPYPVHARQTALASLPITLICARTAPHAKLAAQY
jgi:hypothetical protein